VVAAPVDALRNAIYFNDSQHAQLFPVLAAWAALLLAAMIGVSRRPATLSGAELCRSVA